MDNPFKKLRDKLGITQRELAHRLGKTTTTVANWETGDTLPPLTEAAAIAAAYDVAQETIEKTIVQAARLKAAKVSA